MSHGSSVSTLKVIEKYLKVTADDHNPPKINNVWKVNREDEVRAA